MEGNQALMDEQPMVEPGGSSTGERMSVFSKLFGVDRVAEKLAEKWTPAEVLPLVGAAAKQLLRDWRAVASIRYGSSEVRFGIWAEPKQGGE